MHSVLPANRKDLEDLKKPGSGRQDCDSLDRQRKAETSIPLVARIDWCRQQRRKARMQRENVKWTDGAPKRRISGTLCLREMARPSIGIVHPVCSNGMRWGSRTDEL